MKRKVSVIRQGLLSLHLLLLSRKPKKIASEVDRKVGDLLIRLEWYVTLLARMWETVICQSLVKILTMCHCNKICVTQTDLLNTLGTYFWSFRQRCSHQLSWSLKVPLPGFTCNFSVSRIKVFSVVQVQCAQTVCGHGGGKSSSGF